MAARNLVRNLIKQEITNRMIGCNFLISNSRHTLTQVLIPAEQKNGKVFVLIWVLIKKLLSFWFFFRILIKRKRRLRFKHELLMRYLFNPRKILKYWNVGLFQKDAWLHQLNYFWSFRSIVSFLFFSSAIIFKQSCWWLISSPFCLYITHL